MNFQGFPRDAQAVQLEQEKWKRSAGSSEIRTVRRDPSRRFPTVVDNFCSIFARFQRIRGDLVWHSHPWRLCLPSSSSCLHRWGSKSGALQGKRLLEEIEISQQSTGCGRSFLRLVPRGGGIASALSRSEHFSSGLLYVQQPDDS